MQRNANNLDRFDVDPSLIKVHTLRYSLDDLISRHSLPEVLDRLGDLLHERSRLDEDDEVTQGGWNQLIRLAELATEQALLLATLKEQAGRDLWP